MCYPLEKGQINISYINSKSIEHDFDYKDTNHEKQTDYWNLSETSLKKWDGPI